MDHIQDGPGAKARSTRFLGCLLGGAVGDALGAPIEFSSWKVIRAKYGPDGVQGFVEFEDGHGEFTDDTQMTLFTAEGVLRAHTRQIEKGSSSFPTIIRNAYLRWMLTQGDHPAVWEFNLPRVVRTGWLIREEGLFSRRSPGTTCLYALEEFQTGTIEKPLNNRKGCGGVMRAAPVGLYFSADPEEAFTKGCESAAITHGHPTGYLAAGFLSALMAGLTQGKDFGPSTDEARRILQTRPGSGECLKAVARAVELAETGPATVELVETFGSGWTAEEALAIALYCALSFPTDLRRGVLAAVNHSGDSDSTGAIAGNILGCRLGREGIPDEWVARLTLADVVERMARDLFDGPDSDGGSVSTVWWNRYPGC
jgi:ADP-ribosylglycohydrolase